MIVDSILALGILTLAGLTITYLGPLLWPGFANPILRFLAFGVLTWVLGSLWLGLPFIILVIVYAVFIYVIWHLPGGGA